MFVGQAGAQTVTLISADADLVDVLAVTTDGTHLYVGGSDSDVPSQPRIWRIPIGGGAATRLYTGWGLNTCCAAGLAVVGNDVFWIDPNSGPVTDTEIFRAPKDGSGPITPMYTGILEGQPIVDGSDLTTDGGKLYTADFVQGRVHSLNTDGSAITQLGPNRYGGFFDREHRNLIAEDVGILYIGDLGHPSFGDSPPRVQSIPSAGGAFTTLFLGPTYTSRGWGGLAVGNNTIFLTEGNNILQMPVTGGTPTLLVSDPQFKTLQGITFFNNALYVADNGNFDTTNGPGKIWKVDLDDADDDDKGVDDDDRGVDDDDGDGIPDDEDACLDSILDENIVIDGFDTGVENVIFEDGCTMMDLIGECAASATNHGSFVRCVAHLTNEWKTSGLISRKEKGRIQRCAAHADKSNI